jgi:hypothetical protein
MRAFELNIAALSERLVRVTIDLEDCWIFASGLALQLA